MKATKTAETNRYPYLLSVDLTLTSKDRLSASITFGKEAPGLTGGMVHYCIKRAEVEVTVRDGRCTKILLLDPANIAMGVKSSRKKQFANREARSKTSSIGGKTSVSITPQAEFSGKSQEESEFEDSSSVQDEFEVKHYTFSYRGDKKTNSKWEFEPFEHTCLKGSLDAALATVTADDDRSAFVVDARATIMPKDIEAHLTTSTVVERVKERVLQWFCRSQFDLADPVSHIQLNVST